MKKRGYYLSIFLAIVLVVSLLLGACTTPTQPTTPPPAPTPTLPPTPAPPTPAPPAPAERPEAITFATYYPGGTQYTLHAAHAKLISTYLKITAAPTAGGGSITNLKLLGLKRAEFASAPDYALYHTVRGEAPYTKQSVRLLMKGEPIPLNFVVRANSPIKSVADLKGKSWMFVQTPAPVSWEVGDALLESHGMTRDDLGAALDGFGSSDFMNAIKEGTADAVMCPWGLASAPFVEVARAVDIRMIPFTQEEQDFVLSKLPYVSAFDIPAGTYKGVDEPVRTVAFVQQTAALADYLPDDLVYDCVKVVYDHWDEWLASGGAAAKWYTQEYTCSNFVVPLHAGAVTYFKDTGYWTPEAEALQQKLLKELGETK